MKPLTLFLLLLTGCAAERAQLLENGSLEYRHDSSLPPYIKWNAVTRQYDLYDEHSVITNNWDENKQPIGQ
jgi:hypothetical protein